MSSAVQTQIKSFTSVPPCINSASVHLASKGPGKLNEKAMLVSFTINQFGIGRKDKKATEDTQINFKAGRGTGAYTKRLINKQYLEYMNAAGRAREYHRMRTRSWGEKGERILPATLYFDYANTMADFKAEFELAAHDFINRYPQILIEMAKPAPIGLGKMFRIEDYPPQAALAAEFAFIVNIEPIPVGDDFRVDLTETEVEKIRRQIDEENKRKQAAGAKEIWQKLYVPIKEMVDKLTDPKAKRYHKSIIGNILNVTNILPELNLENDLALETMRKDVIARLCSTPIELIKEDPGVRKELADTADDILNQMGSYMGKAA